MLQACPKYLQIQLGETKVINNVTKLSSQSSPVGRNQKEVLNWYLHIQLKLFTVQTQGCSLVFKLASNFFPDSTFDLTPSLWLNEMMRKNQVKLSKFVHKY
jgi:hypothetical protein